MSTVLLNSPFDSSKDFKEDSINLIEISPKRESLALNSSHTASSVSLPGVNRFAPKFNSHPQQRLPSLDTMKQNISDTQSTKSHLPAQIQLVTNSMKPVANDGNSVTHSNGGSCTTDATSDGAIDLAGSVSAAPVENELRLRRASDQVQQHKRNVSLDSIDLADVIKKQQQSLDEIADKCRQQFPSAPTNAPTAGRDAPHRGSNAGATSGANDIHYHIDGTTPHSKTPSDEMMDSSTLVQIVTGSPVTCNGGGGGESGEGDATAAKELEPKWGQVKKLLAGVTLTILSALCFSITTVIVKFVTDIKPSQMALFRYLGILVLSFPVMMESKAPWFGDNNWWWRLWMLLRSLSGCTSLFFRYSAVTYISLADTTIIMLSMPVFVFIFARIFLGEQFGRFHVLALFLSLVGIAFASKIEILFSSSHPPMEANGTTTLIPDMSTSLYANMSFTTVSSVNASTIAPHEEDWTGKATRQLVGSLFALGAMTIGSLVYIMVRKMRKTHHSVILFNFAIISIVEMSLINYIFYDFSLPTTGYSAYLVTILAVFSFYGQLLLTKAIQIEEAGVVSVVRVSGEAFFAFLFQIIIFGEMPDQYTIAGAILVLTSVFLLSYRKYVLSLPEDAPHRKKMHWLTK